MKRIKKNLGWVFAVAMMMVLILSIVGCFGNQNTIEPTTTPTTVPTTVPTTEPTTVPTTEATEPTTEATEAPTEPATEPATEPTEVPTEPATEPATEPTEPATEPAKEPTEPATKPTETPTEPAAEVTFTDVDETVYATADVNVRSGPGTSNSKVGSLKKGDSIQRIGIGSNGWSKVVYNGETAYIFSDYLSRTKPAANTGNSGNTGDTGNSGNTGDTGNSGNSGNSGNTGETVQAYKQPADPETGISWDGESPILYYYTDGTTGYEPKPGAKYEYTPGNWRRLLDEPMELPDDIREEQEQGIYRCSQCGKITADDGRDGKCVRHLLVDWTCPDCGTFVPCNECHTCPD